MTTELQHIVVKAFTLGQQGNVNECQKVLCSLIPEYSVSEINDMCSKIDAGRDVFCLEIPKGERGIHGLTYFSHRFALCSNIYGHSIDTYKGEYDEKFFDACEDGYDHGILHGLGYVVYDLDNDRFGFLMQYDVGDNKKTDQQPFADIEYRYNIEIEAFAYPKEAICSPISGDARAVFTCLIIDPSMFDKVWEIDSDIQDLLNKL